MKCYQEKDIGSTEVEQKSNYENFHNLERLNLKHEVLVDMQHMVMLLKDQNSGD